MPYSSQASSIATITSSSLALVDSIPHMLSAILTPTTSAVSTSADFNQSLYGVQTYGATEADLSPAVNQTVLDGQACPTTPHDGSTFDSCSVDSAVAQSIACATVAEDTNNSETTKATVDCTGGQPNDTQSYVPSNTQSVASTKLTNDLNRLASAFSTIQKVIEFSATSTEQALTHIQTITPKVSTAPQKSNKNARTMPLVSGGVL